MWQAKYLDMSIEVHASMHLDLAWNFEMLDFRDIVSGAAQSMYLLMRFVTQDCGPRGQAD